VFYSFKDSKKEKKILVTHQALYTLTYENTESKHFCRNKTFRSNTFIKVM